LYVLTEQLQQGDELIDSERVVLERWLDEAKFSRVLKPSTYREAVQRILCHYVFDSRMSQLQAIAVSIVNVNLSLSTLQTAFHSTFQRTFCCIHIAIKRQRTDHGLIS